MVLGSGVPDSPSTAWAFAPFLSLKWDFPCRGRKLSCWQGLLPALSLSQLIQAFQFTKLRLLQVSRTYCTRLIIRIFIQSINRVQKKLTEVDHQKEVGLAWLFLKGNYTNKFPEYFSTCFSPPLSLAPIRTSSPEQKPAALPVHRESMVTLLGLLQAGMGEEGDRQENGSSFDTHQLQAN